MVSFSQVAGLQFHLLLLSVPLVGEIGPGACVSFPMGGLSVWALAIGTESFPSDKQGVWGCLWA